MLIGSIRKEAFTLVEIMIVVSILGLLTAIVVPSYVRAHSASQKTVCVSNLKQIESAILQWATENKKSAGTSVSSANITDYLKGNVMPPEPAGGYYTLTTIDDNPTCNLSTSLGHTVEH